MCGRKGHRVTLEQHELYTLCCERIFNLHPNVNRTALVGIIEQGQSKPLLCVELVNGGKGVDEQTLFAELRALGQTTADTQLIQTFLVHPAFPVDVRHNAKIFREQLTVWAQQQIDQQQQANN